MYKNSLLKLSKSFTIIPLIIMKFKNIPIKYDNNINKNCISNKINGIEKDYPNLTNWKYLKRETDYYYKNIKDFNENFKTARLLIENEKNIKSEIIKNENGNDELVIKCLSNFDYEYPNEKAIIDKKIIDANEYFYNIIVKSVYPFKNHIFVNIDTLNKWLTNNKVEFEEILINEIFVRQKDNINSSNTGKTNVLNCNDNANDDISKSDADTTNEINNEIINDGTYENNRIKEKIIYTINIISQIKKLWIKSINIDSLNLNKWISEEIYGKETKEFVVNISAELIKNGTIDEIIFVISCYLDEMNLYIHYNKDWLYTQSHEKSIFKNENINKYLKEYSEKNSWGYNYWYYLRIVAKILVYGENNITNLIGLFDEHKAVISCHYFTEKRIDEIIKELNYGIDLEENIGTYGIEKLVLQVELGNFEIYQDSLSRSVMENFYIAINETEGAKSWVLKCILCKGVGYDEITFKEALEHNEDASIYHYKKSFTNENKLGKPDGRKLVSVCITKEREKLLGIVLTDYKFTVDQYFIWTSYCENNKIWSLEKLFLDAWTLVESRNIDLKNVDFIPFAKELWNALNEKEKHSDSYKTPTDEEVTKYINEKCWSLNGKSFFNIYKLVADTFDFDKPLGELGAFKKIVEKHIKV